MTAMSQDFIHIHLPSGNLHHEIPQLAMLCRHAEWGLALFVLNLVSSFCNMRSCQTPADGV